MTFTWLIVAFFLFAAVAQDHNFEKDPRLSQSFWGLSYSTTGSGSYPACNLDSIDEVVKDIQLVSQLTTRIRTYGSDCNQTDLILEAIQRTKVNLQVYLGVFINKEPATYERQRNATINALQKYGAENVAGITVGNEYILVNAAGGGAEAVAAEAYIKSCITDMRNHVDALGLGRTIPIGTAETGGFIPPTLAEGPADYVMANSHPYFANVRIDGAAAWAISTMTVDPPKYVIQANKTLFIGEVGWPSEGGSQAGGGSDASVANLQRFLDDFICMANANSTWGYFYFEFVDSLWKLPSGGVEPHWGLFDLSRNLKAVTIPTCLAPPASPPSATQSNTPSGSGVQRLPPVVLECLLLWIVLFSASQTSI